ncbi:MAG: helix-turn-helix transcriptional regulator [Solirubrobacteraceae bacterium]
METKTLAEIRAQRKVTPERRARIDAEKEALRADIALHELREHRGVSQQQLADALDVSRPRVSTIERAGEDLRISTIARYVEALGGKVEIRAVFDDETIPLDAA